MTNPKHGEMTGLPGRLRNVGGSPCVEAAEAIERLLQYSDDARQEGWKAGMEEAVSIVDDNDPQLADWMREKLTGGKD